MKEENPMKHRHTARRAVLGCLAVVSLAAAVSPALAQSAWKLEGPVEIVVPSAPGGGTDLTARLIQKIWQEGKMLDVPVNVANKSGGGGTVALNYLKQFTGNPHYLHTASAVLLTNHISGRSTFSHTDLTPLALLQSEYIVFAVRAESPLKSVQDVVAQLKRDPAALSFAVGTSLGGANHSAAAALARAAGADPRKLRAVVFKSSSESAVAALGGHVDVMTASASLALRHQRSGAMRLLGVASPTRLRGEMGQVPTLKESGVNAVVNNFRLMVAPAGLAPAHIAYWDQALSRMAKTDDWKKDLEKNFVEDTYLNSRDTRKFLDEEYAELKGLLAQMGLAKQ
jgi:putative tricarboxylic transport membrane protein